MTNRIIITGLLLVGLFASPLTNAADLQKGFDAWHKGDYETTLREWTPLAEQGDAKAQWALGQMYVRGWGVPQDYKQALKWWRLAAEQGHVEAQLFLADIYQYGKGVSQNYQEAIKWFRRVTKQSAVWSQYSQGQGEALAQFNLGLIYAKGGEGVPKDNIRAHMWFNIATLAGEEDGQEARELREKTRKLRDRLEITMGADDIATAQARAEKCVASNYEDC